MGWSDARRTFLYTAIVTALAAGLYIPFLNLHPMSGDEPLYAMCVDHMRDGTPRAVLSPTPYPPVPYFQKPPLYMWLTAATAGLFPHDSLAKYRIWSATFGTLTIGGTCLLGALTLGPETGLLAALLLLFNDDWVRNHGVLTGTFDTALTLACLTSFLLYWQWTRGAIGARARAWTWSLIGLLCAAESLLKPAFGILPLILLAIHAFTLDRHRTARAKSLGLATAVAILILGAAWWFILQYHRFGNLYLDQVFHKNIVDRISQGLSPHHVKQAWYYLGRISQSSCAFALAFPALAWTTWIAAKHRDQREPLAFVSLLALGWLALFSISASKYLHYAYPVFPVIAVAVAAMLIAAGGWLKDRVPWGATAATIVVAILIGTDVLRTADGMSSDARRFYAPWSAARALAPAVAAGRCRVVLYRFPDSVARWMSANGLDLEAKDAFYLSHLQADPPARADSESDLERLLDRPTLLIASRFNDLPKLEKDLRLPARTDDRFAYNSDTLIMYGIDLRNILSPHATPDHPNDTLRAIHATPGHITLELTPALRASARITVTTHLPTAPNERLKYTVNINHRPALSSRTRLAPGGIQLFTFEFAADQWSPQDPTTIDLTLDAPYPIQITDAAVDLDVRIGSKR